MKHTGNIKFSLRELFTGLLLFVLTSVGAQNDQLFEEGNKLYNEGAYQEAIQRYKKISESGMHSPELYFNMGNAYYKINEIAPSILYYEKALVLDPEDEDVRVNLAYARNMTIDAIEEMPQTGISKLVNGIIGTLDYRMWSYLAIGAMFLFVTLFIAYYFAYAQGRKRLLFAGSGVSLLLSLVCLLFAFQQRTLLSQRNPAIVFAQETTVKSEPNLGSEEIFRLHEGTKVFILDTLNNWKKIRLSDGKEGWLPEDELRVVKDF
ncbi:SH3 domain-containing protein [Robertkochia flava]|uniref:SH3 domain-containing protein n=1 Tax=Robertkochia flava TaxID=3447986 RepID=UPI001CCE824E|nr:tetratricopeptide repeat protein [Robertkochia marina]